LGAQGLQAGDAGSEERAGQGWRASWGSMLGHGGQSQPRVAAGRSWRSHFRAKQEAVQYIWECYLLAPSPAPHPTKIPPKPARMQVTRQPQTPPYPKNQPGQLQAGSKPLLTTAAPAAPLRLISPQKISCQVRSAAGLSHAPQKLAEPLLPKLSSLPLPIPAPPYQQLGNDAHTHCPACQRSGE